MFVPFGRILRDVVAYAKYPLWLLSGRRPPDNYMRKWERIRAISRELGCRSFIETGTFYGQTVNQVRRHFDRVVSIELYDSLYEYNRKAFRRCMNVRILHGDSASMLGEAIESADGNILYWLDGHYSGEGTAIGESVSPILRELDIIRERYQEGDCIIIDDARMFTGDDGYPTIGEVIEVLKGIDPGFDVSIDGDCIVARREAVSRKSFAGAGGTKDRKFRVLFVGADDIPIPSGVFNYIKGLSSNSRSGRFSYSMTASRVNQVDPFLQKIEFPIDYGFSDLFRNASRLFALIRRHEIDLVHLHTVRAGFLGCIACLFSRTPIVYTGHSWRFLQKDSFLQKSLFYLIEQFICRKADAITFLAGNDHALGKKYRFPINGKSRIVRTRIDRKAFPAAEEGIRNVRKRWGIFASEFVVGNVSCLSDRKDPRTFLLAAAEIAVKVPNARFLWVGDGELRRETDGWIRELGLEGKAVVTGFVPLSEVPDHLHTMDVFLFTSRAEGVPLAILEAQSVGLPVVSARYIGSCLEELLIDRHNCLLFEPGDWKSAARQVVLVHEDTTLRDELVGNGNRHFREHHEGPELMTEEFESIYRALIKGARVEGAG